MGRPRLAAQKYDNKEDKRIYDLHASGHTITQLAARFCVDRSTVRIVIRREGERREKESKKSGSTKGHNQDQ